MGSSKKTVKNASFFNIYNQDNNPLQLWTEMIIKDTFHAEDIARYPKENYLTSIFKYLNKRTAILGKKQADVKIFDVSGAMLDSHASSSYEIIDGELITEPSDEDTIKADYGSLYRDVEIVEYSITTIDGSEAISYTLDNGYTGTVGKNNGAIYKIKYIDNDKEYYRYAFVYDYQTIDNQLHYIVDKFKNEDSDKLDRGILYKYGTQQKSFKEALENEDLKDMLYTMAGKATDEKVKAFYQIDANKNDENKAFQIMVITGIEIDAEDGDKIIVNPITKSTSYNGATIKINEEDKYEDCEIDTEDMSSLFYCNSVMLLPVEFFENSSLVTKYIDVKKYMGIVTYSSKTVKVSFWQSFFFQFLLIVVAIGVAVFTGNMTMLYAIGASVVGQVLGDELGIIFQIALLFATGGFAIGSSFSFLQNVGTVIKFASEAVSMYVKYSIESITKQIKDLDKDRRAIIEQIKDIDRMYLYTPLGKFGYISSIDRRLLYDNYSAMSRLYEYKRIRIP